MATVKRKNNNLRMELAAGERVIIRVDDTNYLDVTIETGMVGTFDATVTRDEVEA